MKLALFDLDHRLLPIVYAEIWSHFLVRVGESDAEEFGARIGAFAGPYRAGSFAVPGYVRFRLDLRSRVDSGDLERWCSEFVASRVERRNEPVVTHGDAPLRSVAAVHCWRAPDLVEPAQA